MIALVYGVEDDICCHVMFNHIRQKCLNARALSQKAAQPPAHLGGHIAKQGARLKLICSPKRN
jgi:hypothetical protein